MKEFETAVAKGMKEAASKPSVCDWTKPASEILEKTESDLSGFSVGDGGGPGMMIGIAVLVAALGAGAYYMELF